MDRFQRPKEDESDTAPATRTWLLRDDFKAYRTILTTDQGWGPVGSFICRDTVRGETGRRQGGCMRDCPASGVGRVPPAFGGARRRGIFPAERGLPVAVCVPSSHFSRSERIPPATFHMSIGMRVFALVVHDRLRLLTSGSVRWMILMTERERLRFRGTGWNMMVGGGGGRREKRKQKSTSDKKPLYPEGGAGERKVQWQCRLNHGGTGNAPSI